VEKNIIINSLSLSGYRSFGDSVQKFEKLRKLNLFIGQNNCGKSNVLRFVHDYFSVLKPGMPLEIRGLDLNNFYPNKFSFGVCVPYGSLSTQDQNKFILDNFGVISSHGLVTLTTIFDKMVKANGGDVLWFNYDKNRRLIPDVWAPIFNSIKHHDLLQICIDLLNLGHHNVPHASCVSMITEELGKVFAPKKISVSMIPAIRKIGKEIVDSSDFSGEGLINKLAKFQNPSHEERELNDKFVKINDFLKDVTGNSTARIEIPFERDTINVEMDDKFLPLDSLGTGIHEVIILASACTILENTVVCMEEPELHLNPILQKKLIRYLDGKTNNQYLISTHSASLMDAADSEIYHIKLNEGSSEVERVTSDRSRSLVCEDLGYHPSDLLQANCIIWVEGPSDRYYINYWLKNKESNLIEGIHYSIMFYGGRLQSHLSGEDLSDIVGDFISLRKLNRRSVYVMDSDKKSQSDTLNSTKERLMEEFDKGPGHTWVSEGREIENYFAMGDLEEAINNVHSAPKILAKGDRYENLLLIESQKGNEGQASKVKVAKYMVENFEADFSKLDLESQIDRLVNFVKDSNPFYLN